uniref:Uncharacterized protein n=1 Tax=Arundo donax TaxID=35708 RepID=A0A0A8YV46_ARUDO
MILYYNALNIRASLVTRRPEANNDDVIPCACMLLESQRSQNFHFSKYSLIDFFCL